MPVASHSVHVHWGRRPMNFLYAGGGGGSKGAGGDGYPPVQLSRPRLKLQPRRLRCPVGSGAPADQHELPERPVRTHIFMDLVSSGSREPPPRRRSPSLIDRLCSGRQDSWRHRHRAEEHAAAEAAAAAAAAAAAPEEDGQEDGARSAPPPPPGPGAGRSGSEVEELISLDQVDQDCFIVPFDMVDRFLPTGHKLPSAPPTQGQRLSLRQTPSPGLSVVIHVLGHLTPLAPSLLQPAPPRHVQLGACVSLLRQVTQTAGTRDALLLSNLERTEQFPFLLYYTVDRQRRSVPEAYTAVVRATQTTFSRLETSYVGEHNIKLYDEVASIARPPLSDQRRPVSDSTGYIVSIFRVLEGDDRRNFERDWLSWTGARLLYRSIPPCAGLRRMVLHKSTDSGDLHYILTCECSNLLDNVVASARALPTLRARLVGYTGIYKLMATS